MRPDGFPRSSFQQLGAVRLLAFAGVATANSRHGLVPLDSPGRPRLCPGGLLTLLPELAVAVYELFHGVALGVLMLYVAIVAPAAQPTLPISCAVQSEVLAGLLLVAPAAGQGVTPAGG